MKNQILTDRAPSPKGPYSQGIVARGRHLYVAGQGPFVPETGQLVGPTFEAQAERTFENLKAIVEESGGTLRDVVKVNVYLANMGDFAQLNEIYQRFFTAPYPVRTTVHSALVGFMIEVDCIAVLPE
jgi:2-iminobutanoate/2-iminopropanoate deaminase